MSLQTSQSSDIYRGEPLTPAIASHLHRLAKVRAVEISDALRLARMQLPASSPAITELVIERELNAEAIAQLEPLAQVAA